MSFIPPHHANPTGPDDLDMAQTLRSGGKPMLMGRYRIVRELGHGGMGTVYLAEDSKLDDRLVAIKMPAALLSQNKRAISDLKREATTSMELSHPSIVTLRSFEEVDQAAGGGVFLVMDYVEGQTLDDLLAEKEKLSEDEAAKLLGPIAEALDYAHGRGVVHRDVKPSNILIDQSGRASITDFGIARVVKDTMTRVTGRQDTSGTLPYMSPQQLMGDPPKPSQDVYSFGALVYECLCGHPPFFQGQIEAQIRDREALSLNDVCGADGPLARQVMKALSKSPEARPTSCREIIAGAGASAKSRKPRGKPKPKPMIELSNKAKPPPAAPLPPPRPVPAAPPTLPPPAYAPSAAPRVPGQPQATGVPSLIFGIVSLVFPIFAIITGPIAIISGGRTYAAAKRGAADDSAVSMAKVGRVCGCLGLLLALVAIGIVAIAITMAILAAQAEQQQHQPGYYDNATPYEDTW